MRQSEMEDLMVDVEKANSNASAMEKKQKQFDKLIGEWKQKCENITLELEASQKEARQYSTEMFKLKAQYQESQESLDAAHRESKNLSDEIRDLVDQLGNGGKSVHEIQKHLKRVESDKEELQRQLKSQKANLDNLEGTKIFNQPKVEDVKEPLKQFLNVSENQKVTNTQGKEITC
jgi:chromosome segregation ATPase